MNSEKCKSKVIQNVDKELKRKSHNRLFKNYRINRDENTTTRTIKIGVADPSGLYTDLYPTLEKKPAPDPALEKKNSIRIRPL